MQNSYRSPSPEMQQGHDAMQAASPRIWQQLCCCPSGLPPPTPTLEEIFEISAPHSHIQGSYFSERGASLKLQELMQSLSLVLCFLKEDFFFNF